MTAMSLPLKDEMRKIRTVDEGRPMRGYFLENCRALLVEDNVEVPAASYRSNR